MTTDDRLYAKLTLDFADSPKIAPLSDKAFRQFIEALLWSRRLMTDGFVPERMAGKLFDPEALDELMNNDTTNPSMIRVVDGYQIHDYHKHQLTKDWVEQKREAGRRGGLAKAASSEKVAPARKVLADSSSENLPELELEKELELEQHNNVTLVSQRADVEMLCSLLVELVVGNGAKEPTVTKAWRDEARLMLDKDGRPVDEAVEVMRWCQADSFWRSNILSMPTFRKQYDRLKLKAMSEVSNQSVSNARKNLSVVEQFARMESQGKELEA